MEHKQQGRKNKKRRNKCNEQKTVTNMVDINQTTLIFTLNVNCQNIPNKRQIFKVDKIPGPSYLMYRRNPLKYIETYKLKVKVREKKIPCSFC